jgi:TRAP-type C4-dicarboxylate transport system permease small subunit
MAPDEIAKIALVWMTFLGFALAINDRSNIRVDLIDQYIHPRHMALLDVVLDLAILAMMLFIVVKSWILVVIGSRQAILGTPFHAGITNLGFFVGGILVVFFALMRILRRIAALRAGTH